jgi:hypothetical protein
LTAASATFALKAGVWFRRARLLIVSPDSRANLARRQAETPLIAPFSLAGPALTKLEYGAAYLALAALLAVMTYDVHEMLGRFARPV